MQLLYVHCQSTVAILHVSEVSLYDGMDVRPWPRCWPKRLLNISLAPIAVKQRHGKRRAPDSGARGRLEQVFLLGRCNADAPVSDMVGIALERARAEVAHALVLLLCEPVSDFALTGDPTVLILPVTPPG